jgi:hypothetical protein
VCRTSQRTWRHSVLWKRRCTCRKFSDALRRGWWCCVRILWSLCYRSVSLLPEVGSKFFRRVCTVIFTISAPLCNQKTTINTAMFLVSKQLTVRYAKRFQVNWDLRCSRWRVWRWLAVFWVVASCKAMSPDDGSSKRLRNVGKLLSDCTAHQPRSQPSSASSLFSNNESRLTSSLNTSYVL